ncbi:MAG TPA: alpha/beta hydrolase [Acidimicrobiia bacterium]|jgi:pimeloyl-ACP methyl ester carboxylesterase|nr:alpha/beta hydrolase [Acidimicrobiia bacterium]
MPELELDDTSLYYDTTGEGPAVLFIHAGVADSRMWNRQWSLDGCRLVRFDMRGFGRSGLGSVPFTNHADALQLLDDLDVGRAVIVGCSIGAEATLQIAHSAPERVAGLVLVGGDAPGFDPGIDYESPEWPEAVAAFEEGDLGRVAALEAEIWLAGRDRSIADINESVVKLFIDMNLIALKNETRREELDVAQPLDELPEVDAPVQVIVGDRDLPQLIAAAEHLAGQLSDTSAEIITGTAHLPSMDRPDVFNTIIKRFLASI